MQPRALWPPDPIFVEIGIQNADLALGLQKQGYTKYLGVSTDQRRIDKLQAAHPQLAEQFTCSQRRRLVLHNNADVLVLSGAKSFYLWKFAAVRHARCVAWRMGWNPLWLVALLGCLLHMTRKRYAWPQMVSVRAPAGKTCRMLVSKVLRHKFCHRNSLHFIPHVPGLTGMFQKFDAEGVRYVVLRWFDALPEIEPSEDVDMLIHDESLPTALKILHALPGIQPSDVYSETGLPRSEFCGTPYYPPRVARRILDSAVRHKDLCYVPDKSAYFHSLAYHAVYHKGLRSGLPRGTTGLKPKGEPGHDYTGILQSMADELGIDVEISLEGLHDYLQKTDWGPTPDMLAHLAAACPRNRWLQLLTKRLTPDVHDQGLTVFALRQEVVQRGFQPKIVNMIEHSGFNILAVKVLSPEEVEYAAARTRGGNWSPGPYRAPGGPPAVAVIAYDPQPIRLNRKQRRRFPQRTNARIFVKEKIRDAVLAYLPANQQCNALHSSDHAAEAWHLIDVMAPEMIDEIHARIAAFHQPADKPHTLRLQRAASHTAKATTPLRRTA